MDPRALSPLPRGLGPCDQDQVCDPELVCFSPEGNDKSEVGQCTWACQEDVDCADLSVDVKAVPMCLGGVCALRCWEFDSECPSGMICGYLIEGESQAVSSRNCSWGAE